MLNLILNSKISASIGSQLSSDMFSNSLSQDYQFYKENESSEIISASTIYIKETVASINAVLQILSSLVLGIFITGSLLYANFVVAGSIIVLFAIIYYLISRITNNRLKSNSRIIAHLTSLQVKNIQEGLGAIREIIMHNFYKKYTTSSAPRVRCGWKPRVTSDVSGSEPVKRRRARVVVAPLQVNVSVMELDGNEWEWMGLDGNGWDLMGLDGIG